MQKLPLSPAARKVSDSLLTEALYRSGLLFRERLNHTEKSIEMFSRLQTKYPSNRYAPEVLYISHGLYTTDKQTAEANRVKGDLITRYPESKYAQMLQDPNYLNTLAAQQTELDNYYNATYALYEQANYDEVKKRAMNANTMFKENPLQPKFDLLTAFVVGHTENKEAYMTALQTIVAKYPTDEVKAKAAEILAYLEGKTPTTTAPLPSSKTAQKFKYEPNTKHYLVIAFDNYTSQISAVTTAISNFNGSDFSANKLKTNQMLLNPEKQILLVKEFDTADKANIYYQTLTERQNEVINVDSPYQVFMISKTNFTQYFKDKDTAAYLEFFNSNYNK